MNFPSYFCLNFGLPLEDRPEADIRADLERLARHDAVALNESLFYVRPGLADLLRILNPKIDVYLVLNASGVWYKPSQYFPTMAALGDVAERNGLWMKKKDGSRVIVTGVGWPDFSVIDFSSHLIEEVFSTLALAAMRERNVDGVFLDECYRSLTHMDGGSEFRYAGNWSDAQRRIIRKLTQVSNRRPIVNGTMTATGAGFARFWQNCETLRASELIARTLRDCEEQPVSTRRIVWQFNQDRERAMPLYHGLSLASLYDASTCWSDREFRGVADIVYGYYIQGSWGDGARDSNGLPLVTVDGEWHTREFQKRTVSVNIVTGEVKL